MKGKWKERAFEGLKRLERWYYASAYEENRLARNWMGPLSLGPQGKEVVLPFLSSTDEIKSILVYKPDELGDAIYSLPALLELRKHFPKAKITLVCQPKVAAVFERVGLVDKVLTQSPRTLFRRYPITGPKKLLKQNGFGEFDVAIFLRTYPHFFRAFLSIPAKIHIHPRDPRLTSRSVVQPWVSLWGEDRAHQSVQMLQIISALTGKQYAVSDVHFPKFQWTADDEKALSTVFPSKVPARYGVIHPFANFETRCYPLEYWVELSRRVTESTKIPWIIIGGPENPSLPSLPALIQAQGKLSLAQSGRLLSGASVFLGNLSGPVHWATALGIPTITMMSGHSVPAEWNLPGRKALTLRMDVACAPCHLRTCIHYDLACVRKMTPDLVWPHLEGFLSKLLRSESDLRPSKPSTTSVELSP